MTDTLLQTKLYLPPHRPSSISRPRLIQKLNTGLNNTLTLISAPAGFGKTTIIADWIHNSQFVVPYSQFAWLSLDEYDDDPNRFWQYVVAALQTSTSQLGASTQQLLTATPLPPPPALLTGLLNELAQLAQPIILVLDDYHLIADPTIHDGLAFLLDHAPPLLHLVLITRADPPLPLPRLRARGQLNEIRAADLRFTLAETAVFLRESMGLSLSTADVAALESRTEGWITGLYLTAVSLQGRADKSDFVSRFSGSHQYILEYLTEEVLNQQPDDVQTFLLQTSILSRLSAPLCDAVTGRSDSQTILEQLQRQNLFITPLDDGRSWFRTHHLLADLLHNHLRLTATPDQLHTLHGRASLWCEEREMWETAVSHAIASEDWRRVADLVTKAHRPLMAQGHVATWQRWLGQIPALLIQARPALHMRQAWAIFLKGDVLQAETMLLAARESLLALPPSPEQQALRGELAAYLATAAFFREDPAQVIQAAEEALACLPPEAITARARATSALGLGVSLAGDTRRALGLFQETVTLARTGRNPFFLAHALEVLADGQFHTAQLRQSAATCREIIALGTENRAAPLPFAGNGYLKLAAIYVEWHELAQAEEAVATGLALNQQGGIGYNTLQDLCTQVRLRQALGDEAGALAVLHQAEEAARRNLSRITAVQMASCAVQFWLYVGDVGTAAAWAEARPLFGAPLPLAELPVIAQEVQQVSLARIALAQNRPDGVLEIYECLYPQAQAAGR
ncbi:MAG: hypothetical protein KC415_10470, partial [Anaerolineales bacterium]|nr:hypothetical protein [Anaerolineales bacterium]